MKTDIIVAAALMLGSLILAGRLCAETEPQAPPAAETGASAPGIIVTPPVSILPPPPEMVPPASSPPSHPAPSCPATDRKLELIG